MNKSKKFNHYLKTLFIQSAQKQSYDKCCHFFHKVPIPKELQKGQIIQEHLTK